MGAMLLLVEDDEAIAGMVAGHLRKDGCEVTLAADGRRAAVVVEEKLGIGNYKMTGGETLRLYDPGISPVRLSRELILNGVGIEAMSKRTVSLESYFLRLIEGGRTDA